MKEINLRKLIFLNFPYLLFVWLFDKVAQAVRLSPGTDISAKVLNLGSGFGAAFQPALGGYFGGDSQCSDYPPGCVL